MRVATDEVRLATPGEAVDRVSATVHRPSRRTGPALLLVHGAGGDKEDAGLVALAAAVAARGHLVVRANLPYREAGAKRRPPRADRAVAGYRALFDTARAELAPDHDWAAGGKSYGGRVASMAAVAGMGTCGLVFYSYPLHPPGQPDRLRVEHWPDLEVPCLFLQGTRDTFGSPELLDGQLRRLGRRATVEVVDGGDHSLRITGKASHDGRPHRPDEVLAGLGPVVGRWLDGLG